ncbi:MAG: hypothetical protein B6U89_05735 [Desulfurococcales archaeon ex4484_58]|nr:MAG: hypothetical protein B6U89_05735 [Desulfurococcales archaeon ex4484_58]
MKLYEASEFDIKLFEKFVDEALNIASEIEKIRGSRVFILFIGEYRNIDRELIGIINKLIDRVEGDLDIILYSSGGLGDQAYVVGRYLQENVNGKLSFMIPRWAKSAATILSCSGDEIVMTRIAELGPIDPVIYVEKVKRYVPALSIIELFKTLPHLGLPDNLLKDLLDKLPVMEIGDYQRILEHNIELTAKLLNNRMFRDDQDKAYGIASKLASYKHHGAPITLYDALEIGLKIVKPSSDLEKLLIKLHSLWEETILWYEESTITGIEESVNIMIGDRGVFLTRTIHD